MLEIRPTDEKDLSTLSGIYVEAYNPLNIGEEWTDQTALRMLKHFYEVQPDLFFTAEEDGEIIGCIVALIKPFWDGYHLTDGELFLSPQHQKKGVGKKLIQHMFIAALEKYQAVSWDTFTHNIHEHPLKWYKSLGFEEIHEWTMISGNIKDVLEKIEEVDKI